MSDDGQKPPSVSGKRLFDTLNQSWRRIKNSVNNTQLEKKPILRLLKVKPSYRFKLHSVPIKKHWRVVIQIAS